VKAAAELSTARATDPADRNERQEHLVKVAQDSDKKRTHIMKAKRHAENVAYIKSNPSLSTLMMSDDDLDAEALRIYTTKSEKFNGLSPQEALHSKTFSIYTGTTKRSLKE
jgi:hypothetical protein